MRFFEKYKITLVTFILVFFSALYLVYLLYQMIRQPVVRQDTYIEIPTNTNFPAVVSILKNKQLINNEKLFSWLADKKNYQKKVLPGRYLLTKGMNNNQIINLLRSGKQEPVRLILNNLRNKEQLVAFVAPLLEFDEFSLNSLINDTLFIRQYGFNEENVMAMFIADSYQFYWNTSALGFFNKIYKSYNNFWNDKRRKKAASIGLSPIDVSILASIIQRETNKVDEMPVLASIYINRLRKGMLLQADPTVIYAVGDFSIKRVLNKHLEFDSPYNTYKYPGLPPGPITMPEPLAIDQVLNHSNTNYLYFCAKDDFSGYHNYSSTLAQHIAFARKYHLALSKINSN
ncbi:MAG: endolytic transglycosylase MltG [Bacteroidales bacterium]|nr:endolytic transglycosylase MltG [Bacteroidales bacterium]